MTEHVLTITDLTAEVAGREVLKGVDLTVRSGEVHVIMGPNGSGKSTLAHALMGRPGTTITGGSITIDGNELVGTPAHVRAQAGLFLALQQPIEVPGVSVADAMVAAGVAAGDVVHRLATEASTVGLRPDLLERALNVDLSGGEAKRNEIVQLATIRPLFAILDEIDSGLDVDALSAVSRRVESATDEWGLGVLAITHFQRLLDELHADVIHVLAQGRIQRSGGPELALELEATGYGSFEA
jgi:Fe-S cluster assembly ATP-binding protein